MRIFVMIGAVLGLLVLLVGIVISKGAPQEAAMAAMACAFAVIPYVGWRASQIDENEREQRKFRKELLDRLEALEKSTHN